MSPCAKWKFTHKWLLFFVLCVAAVVISSTIEALVPEIPADVLLAAQRHKRQREVLQKWKTKKEHQGTESPRQPLTGRCDLDFANIGACEVADAHPGGCWSQKAK